MNLPSYLLFLIGLMGVGACQQPEKQVQHDSGLHLPLVTSVTVDGDYSEWEGVSAISLTADEDAQVSPQTFEGAFKVAWKPNGLAFYAEVKDDFLKEAEAPILQNDGLELFISEKQGSKQMIQYIISPGITEAFPEARIEKVDYGTGQSFTGATDMQLIASPIAQGYQLEGFIPFTSLGFAPQQGDSLALNFYLNDADQEGRAVRHNWHYFPSTYSNRRAQYQLVLSEEEQLPQLTTKVFLEDTVLYRFSVLGAPLLAGKEISLRSGDQTFAKGQLMQNGSYAVADFSVEKASIPTGAAWALWLEGSPDQPIDPALVPLRYVNLLKPHRYEQAIRIFEAEDRQKPQAKGGVLFIGSSSIRMWPHLAQDFPELEVIQRGFGGSRTEDVLYFYDRIVTPYKPATIIFFEGVNDINAGRSPDSVVANTEQFLQQVARDLPDTEVILLSTTISVRKKALKDKYLATNVLLEQLAKQYPNTHYLNLVPEMLNEQGQPRPEIFGKDSTHMNPEGYKIWTKKIRPLLVK